MFSSVLHWGLHSTFQPALQTTDIVVYFCQGYVVPASAAGLSALDLAFMLHGIPSRSADTPETVGGPIAVLGESRLRGTVACTSSPPRPIQVAAQLWGSRCEWIAQVQVRVQVWIHGTSSIAVTAVPLVQSLQGGDVDVQAAHIVLSCMQITQRFPQLFVGAISRRLENGFPQVRFYILMYVCMYVCIIHTHTHTAEGNK